LIASRMASSAAARATNGGRVRRLMWANSSTAGAAGPTLAVASGAEALLSPGSFTVGVGNLAQGPGAPAALARGPTFRYSGRVRVCSGARTVALAALALCLLGCGRGARTPEEAYGQLVQAVRARDGARLYAALDLETRWSWMTVRRCHREAYDIVLGTFPESAERTQQLRRFETGALSEDDAGLFAAQLGDGRWLELGRGLLDGARVELAGEDEARALGADGRVFGLRRAQNGRWGFAGLADEAEQAKRRALADLDLIRTNAADYERAATREGK
jgi:hypothetical protein